MSKDALIGLLIPAIMFLLAFIGVAARTDDHEKRIKKLEQSK